MQRELFPRELSPETVLQALEVRVGEINGITATELVMEIVGTRSTADERRLRQIVEALRKRGHAVCAHPASGYFIAANAEEMDATCRFLVARAMTTLEQVAACKRVALPDLYGQLGLEKV